MAKKAHKVRDAMTANPIEIQMDATLAEAAMAMKGADVGAMLVLEDGTLRGIVTDRDIAIRAVAESKDPSTKVREIVSSDLVTVAPDDDLDDTARLAREKALRRFPVVENGQPVGIVSLGDLALAQDPNSALADISAAPAND